MKTILTSAFSINMLTSRSTVQFRPLSLAEAKEFFLPGYMGKAAEWESAVEHLDTATIFSQVLGFEVPVNEIAIQLDFGTRLLVGRYRTTEIQWWLVTRGGNNG